MTAVAPALSANSAGQEMAPATQPPQFFRGFEGAAIEPFPEAARKVLAEPPDPRDVEIKPDGIVFLPGVAYRRILTRAFGAGGWSILPRSPARVMGNIVIYHGALVCLGRFVAEAVGECFYRENNPNMSYASCVEGAKTDALSRCCKDLGIATDLWDANWREEWKAKYATIYQSKDRDGKPKTMWKLKSRVSNPHDLMAGAGGVAPAPAKDAPASVASSPAAKTGTAGSSAASAEGAAGHAAPTPRFPTPPPSSPPAAPVESSPPSDDAPADDTGEAATGEQLEAIKGRLRVLGWKVGYMRLWFSQHFGITVQEPARILGALTQQQADNVFLLLNAQGNPALVDRLLSDMVAKGQAK
jgi:hypothetical protein